LREKVKSRDLSGWHDKEDPEAEAILNKLPAEDREFARLCYPEELDQFSNALRRKGEALQTKVELMGIAIERMPE
jgi:hypothetical protein